MVPTSEDTNLTVLENEADTGLNALVNQMNETGSSLVQLGCTTNNRLIYLFLLPLLSIPTLGIFSIYMLIDAIIGGSLWKKYVACGDELDKLKERNEALEKELEQLKSSNHRSRR